MAVPALQNVVLPEVPPVVHPIREPGSVMSYPWPRTSASVFGELTADNRSIVLVAKGDDLRLTGNSGKRLRTSDPLTEHDVAERLDRAALRTARIMTDIRQQGFTGPVKRSRYLTNALSILAAELQLWGIEPQEGWEEETRGL
jgi:hypothetical protein